MVIEPMTRVLARVVTLQVDTGPFPELGLRFRAIRGFSACEHPSLSYEKIAAGKL